MKKLFTAVMLLSIVTIASFSQGGHNAIFSTDGNFVIAVGDNGNLRMSYDGGLNYGSYPIPGFNFNGAHGFGSRVIIVGDAGAVQTSSNGGVTFTNTGIG